MKKISNRLSLFDIFGIGIVHSVSTKMKETLETYTKSDALLAIHLTEIYKTLYHKEQLCMLMILDRIANGRFRPVISLMNISRKDRLAWLKFKDSAKSKLII